MGHLTVFLRRSFKTGLRTAARLAAVLLILALPEAAAAAGCNSAAPGSSGAGGGQKIASAAQLQRALAAASGGEAFLLQPGNYGTLAIARSYRAPVTISSANAARPACLTGLRLNGAANLRLSGLLFSYDFARGDPKSVSPFRIGASRNITIEGALFDGDLARGGGGGGRGYGIGLNIKDSVSVTISRSEFRRWRVGLLATGSAKLAVLSSNLHSLRSDGITLSGISGLRIEGNRFHNFHAAPGAGDHRDMIQIMRVRPEGSSDIVIRNNIFDMGRGDYTQTIFAGSSGKNLGLRAVRHRNVRIEDNMIYNAHAHGISIHGVDNITVRRNALIRVPGGHSDPAINLAPGSTGVVIEQNIAPRIVGHKNQRGWRVANNALIPPRSAGGQFVYHATGAKDGYNRISLRPGSLAARLNAGPAFLRR
ncbi:right-handed parallel beta-helix repeat-containing protein (plasmid) [Roseobacteraceae bacterium NS-SX3]